MKSFNVIRTALIEQQEQFRKLDLGTPRNALTQITTYKDTPHPIIISGLRRSGKSTLLAQLAYKFYPHNEYFFINFEDERFLAFIVSDFTKLHELLIELFGNQRVFLLDEIQNVPGWERFVSRMVGNNYKFYITGSNASLLSRELGTKLTGRYIPVELFPFSWDEYLRFRKLPLPDINRLTTIQHGVLKNAFSHYLKFGGIPQALQYPKLPIHKTLYDDILYRDVATRYKISDVTSLKQLAFYLLSNFASLVSYNKLKALLQVGSVNTIKSYIGYLETSWLLFVVNRYAFSVKQQQIANKKIYCVDTGLTKSVAFAFSKNSGKFLENIVFLELRRRHTDIYYYKTKKDREVDFYLPRQKIFIQVSQSIEDAATSDRETSALLEAMEEVGKSSGYIVTENEKDELVFGDIKIRAVSIYEWLLTKK